MKVLRIVTQLIPAVRELVAALSPRSPGGKRVTPEEWEGIVDVFLRRVRRVIEAELRGA